MIKNNSTITEPEWSVESLSARLHHRDEELAVINSVQEALVAQLSMPEIYKLVGEKIREIFNAQVLDIVTYDRDKNLIEDQYAYEKGETTLLGPRAPSGFRKHIIQSQKHLVLNHDIEKYSLQYNNPVVVGEIPKSAVLVPLLSSGEVTGIISLQNLDQENAFSESDVSLLTTLANSMSVALKSARLFDQTNHLLKETEQRTAELAVINSVQEGLAKELDIQAIYDLVGNRIRDLFDAQVVGIATFDHEKETENIHYLIEKGERYYPEPRPLNILRKHLIQSKEKILINKNFEEVAAAFGVKKVPGTEQPKSALYVPLILGDKVTGNISLQNIDKENAISESDVRLLETLANSMSVALENARLFDETSRLLKETEQGKAELAVINNVQEGLVRQLDMQGIYELVGEKIRQIFNAQVIDIATYDSSTDLLEDRYAYEKGDRTLVGKWKPTGFRKHVIETGQLFLINKDLERISNEFDSKVLHGEQPKSLVFVPLVSGNEVKGMISLQNLDEENAFPESQVGLLTTLANSMSVALESARRFDETNRLLKETEQRNAELAVINSVQESLVAQMDMQSIYELVGEKIREIFGAQVIDIVLYDKKLNLIEDRYSYEKGDRTMLGPREPKGFRKHVIQTKQLLLHNENVEQAMRDFDNVILIGETPKSQIYVPMMAAGEVTGIISLQNLDHEKAFSASDVNLITTLANSMSVALESARLFDETNRLLKETEQRNAELAVINSVQESLVAQMDMQSIYELVGEKIREIFGAQVIDIVLYDKKANLIEDRYAYEKGDRTLLGPREPKGFRKHVIKTKQLLLHNENVEQAMQDFDNVILIGEKPKSQIYVPMMAGGDVSGIISLQNLDHENAFSESDVNLLTTLANSMTVALESARLFDETNRLLKETEQRTAELSVINSVQEGLAKQINIQSIYELVGEKMREIFNAQVIDIVTYDSTANLMEDRYSFEKGDRTLAGTWKPEGFRKAVIESGQLLLINENLEKIRLEYDSKVLQGEQPKSAIFVPLVSGNEVKGMISLQNLDKEHAFSDSDVNLLTTLANSMTVALESARLFDETNRLLKETEQRTAELSVINSVQEGLAKELDIQGIYELVGEKMRDIFNAQVIDIVTYDKTNNTVEDRYTYEKGDRTLLGPRPLRGFRKYVIETSKPLVINKDLHRQRSKYDQSVIVGKGAKSIVLVPMFASGEVTGVISLQNLDEENAFSNSDVKLLSTLSNSMSVALESARLFDETTRLLKETEQRTGELSVINSVQEGLAKELDMQGIYDLIGDRVQKLFNAQSVLIATLDLDNKVEHFNYAVENNQKFQHESRPFNKLRKLLIEKRHSIYIPTEEIAKKEYGLSALSGTQMSKSLLFVPLLTGNVIRGYVSLQNVDKENAFSESDIRLLETLANSMSVALENARLFDETNRLLKETEQRTAELAVINSVQEGLAKELDMQGIYNLVGDRAQHLFQTHAVIIASFDLVNNTEHFNYAFENGEKYKFDSRPINNLRKILVKKKQTIHIENETKARDEYGITAIGDTRMPKSLMFVPLLSGNAIKGYISIQNVDKENAFNDSDVRLLETLANSMSVALENARLFDETNRLLKETELGKKNIELLSDIGKQITASLDFETIFYKLYEHINQLMDATIFGVGIYNAEAQLLEYKFAIENGKRYEPYTRSTKDKDQFPVWCIEKRKPVFINDVTEQYSKYISAYKDVTLVLEDGTFAQDPLSLIYLPLIVQDKMLGIITIQSFKKNAYTEYHLNLLQNLATYTGIAIDNANAYRKINEREKEIAQRAAELSTVNSISQALAVQLNLDDLIKLVGDQLLQLFNANIVYLALLDKKSQIINFPYQHGDDMDPLKLGEGLTSKIILTGEPLLLNKDLQESRAQLGVKQIGIPAASYLGVPIPAGDEIIGVLSIQSTEQENRFNENDLHLLSTIAASVGVAIRKAKLFEEVHQAKMEAEAASKTAEKANQAKSAFLSTVSHELRTPLTSVLGFAKIIKKRLEDKIFPLTDQKDSKTAKAISQISENLSVVISEGERLTNLINEVLDLAKIEAGKMEWNMENVSMQEVAERAIAATSSLFEQKHLSLEKNIEAELPFISGDRDKLIQVIVNLISNAVKFTPQGTVKCIVKQSDNEIIVSITDTGIGIAPEDHDAVFEQFKQVVGDTLTDKPKGTGLGLPICKEIVEHHGGRIWLQSAPGKGSTFSFALPVIDSHPKKPFHLDELVKQLKRQMAKTHFKIEGKNSTILVVDDDGSIRSLLHQELSDAGYLIEEATNGKEALESVRKNRPDLIILDVMMPEMNGFDVAAILKNDPQTMDIPIIVLSIVQDKARGYRIGVDRYLTKPIDTAALFNEVGTLLEQGKSKRKVMVVDEDNTAVRTLSDVLHAKGYQVVESDGKELLEKAIATKPDIIILNSVYSGSEEIVQTLRFEKGLENVLFLIYQ
jgi:GAF domain-containing protein/CheY-like chemotaxis protein